MNFLLRRYLWVVDLIGIGIGSALAGHATALMITAALPSPAAAQPRSAHAAIPPRAEKSDKSANSIEGIVDRNIFCSTCDVVPAPEGTRRPLRLLAIMFAPPPSDPLWSRAIVRDEEAAITGAYAVGAAVGGATISDIQDVRVVLDVGGGRRELLELLPRRPDEPLDRRLPADERFDVVRRVGPHSYEIRRAALDRFGDGTIPPWPRVVLVTRDGAPIGFRLGGVRADGPFAAAGLAGGDILLEANGQSLASPDAALVAATALHTAGHVDLLIERAGRRIRLDYVIR